MTHIACFIYALCGVLTYIAWVVLCKFENEPEIDYSDRYYSKSKVEDNILMLIVCLIGWPFILMMFVEEREKS